ncbi:hypothetical protein LTSESEN_3011 [Salmonella enterica subsp. enterica serovar Senftenberg str. A4-543]|uniref:Uncharacterized protein n=1 Tax=Salmonella enterica subsp. enterica serovar Senftenberg str. A4-543 TaxID=913082 RepID=G5R146_SALSE|nr:hypothetical protein LTSESEN_3011 [Salmonella enterica subsp. enterica serovar Senftenberg str. A4-543]
MTKLKLLALGVFIATSASVAHADMYQGWFSTTSRTLKAT